jgi:hypothetical protein
VVDEAGMLDQDTARALLTVADECRVRLALLGDRVLYRRDDLRAWIDAQRGEDGASSG